MPTNILIVGAGAVGAFYASRLAQDPSTSISVICRSNYSVVVANGFSITSPTYGSYSFTPAHTFPNPKAAVDAGIDWDFIVVSTKALPDVSDDSQILTGLVGGNTAIVLIQNGLGVEEPYTKRFPSTTILSAVTIVSAAQTSHGVIKHNRWTRISIGPYLPSSSSSSSSSSSALATSRNTQFVNFLKAGGIRDAEPYSHSKLQAVRWHKIAINASMNPSAVLSGGSTNNTMSLDPELSIHLLGCMEEVLTTAPRVLGLASLPAEFATSEQILKSTQKNTSGSKPSMLLDWEQGKTMELEVILGNPVRIAREKGFEMPRLQSLYALLRMAQQNRDAAKKQNSKM